MTLYSSGSVLDKSSSRVSARSIAMFFNVRFLVLIPKASAMERTLYSPMIGRSSLPWAAHFNIKSNSLACIPCWAAPAAAPKAAPAAAPAAPKAAPAGGAGSIEVKAGAAGKVFKIEANVGQAVKKGDAVVIIEAMKMEIPVVAPEDGTVASIDVAVGDAIDSGAVLATLN